MKHYRKITFWENKARLKLLIEFRNLVITYFDNSRYEWMAEGRIEEQTAKDARSDINRTMDKVYKVIRLADKNPSVISTPAPLYGGYVKDIDLIHNIFNLHDHQIPTQTLIDHIERAIGQYESNKRDSIIRTISPLFWIIRLFSYIVEIPFTIIGTLGFNKERAESSVIGRIIKGFLYFVMAFASFLTILHLMGWLEEAKKFIGISQPIN